MKVFVRIFLILFSICIVQPAFSKMVATESSELHFQKMVLFYVNQYRAKKHLPPLRLVNNISTEAAQHSQDMASQRIPFGHQWFNTRIKHIYKEIKNCRAAAENVAYYKMNAKKLVEAWIASPGHRRNIEGRYNLTGIGVAHGKKGWGYYTQIFIKSDDKRYS
ncbi:putative transporter (plasmid) [Legionella adelaidensis]|uniref:Putative transporter n=1 Tax=Legionella adelaidensis TaxID=45056 RepID=A0A0W0R1Y3_9GAMM|nr:CAP domain-containing protein [Legionella adelaidensis]KTC65064.1 putative transporter [Legionella adelaidensis]VEH85416.1 putative transporter [Legionella adelaidensis]